MRPRQKYVRLTESQILVLPRHRDFVYEQSTKRGVSVNQTVRDMIEHAMTCPFFNGNDPIGGTISQSGK